MRAVFQCDFCSFSSKEAKEVIKHEEKCESNPQNKVCLDCTYFMGIKFTTSPIITAEEASLRSRKCSKCIHE